MRYTPSPGDKFNRLTFVRLAESRKKRRYALFECDCGCFTTTKISEVVNGKWKSCGCLQFDVVNSDRHIKYTTKVGYLVGPITAYVNSSALFSNVSPGHRYGSLVTESVPYKDKKIRGSVVDCICDCGNKVTKPVRLLSHGQIKSCGCAKSIYESKPLIEPGDRFGLLTAIEKIIPATDQGFSWKCKCDCGADHVARQKDLKSLSTKSCGCLKHSHRPLQSAILKRAFSQPKVVKEFKKASKKILTSILY